MSRAGGPLYARLLGLRHLRLTQLSTFALFEGSVLFAIVLALAEIVSPWGVLAIPAAVAVIAELNPIVAGGPQPPPGIGPRVRPRRGDPLAGGLGPRPDARPLS